MLPKSVSDKWKQWVGFDTLYGDVWNAKAGRLQPSEERALRRRLILFRILVFVRSIVLLPIRSFTFPCALFKFAAELERLHFSPLRRVTKGNGCVIDRQTWLIQGQSIFLGDNVKVSAFSSIMAGEKATVTIGSNTIMGPGVLICAVNHGHSLAATPMRFQHTEDSPEFSVKIGENVWIGAHVSILPGTEIGDDCIIGAGSVVTKKIPPGTICFDERVLKVVPRTDRNAPARTKTLGQQK